MPENNGSAKGLGIAAICCGGVGVCVPLLALVGLLLGVIGLFTARPGQRSLPGVGTGVSAGAFLVNIILMLAILLPAFGADRSVARQMQEQTQLREIGSAWMGWMVDNKGRYPGHVADLEASGYVTDPSLYISPFDEAGSVLMVVGDPRPMAEYTYGSFTFMPVGGYSVDDIRYPSSMVLAYSTKPNGNSPRHSVYFADGHVELLTPEELKLQLEQSLEQIPPDSERRFSQ